MRLRPNLHLLRASSNGMSTGSLPAQAPTTGTKDCMGNYATPRVRKNASQNPLADQREQKNPKGWNSLSWSLSQDTTTQASARGQSTWFGRHDVDECKARETNPWHVGRNTTGATHSESPHKPRANPLSQCKRRKSGKNGALALLNLHVNSMETCRDLPARSNSGRSLSSASSFGSTTRVLTSGRDGEAKAQRSDQSRASK